MNKTIIALGAALLAPGCGKPTGNLTDACLHSVSAMIENDQIRAEIREQFDLYTAYADDCTEKGDCAPAKKAARAAREAGLYACAVKLEAAEFEQMSKQTIGWADPEFALYMDASRFGYATLDLAEKNINWK